MKNRYDGFEPSYDDIGSSRFLNSEEEAKVAAEALEDFTCEELREDDLLEELDDIFGHAIHMLGGVHPTPEYRHYHEERWKLVLNVVKEVIRNRPDDPDDDLLVYFVEE